MTILCKVQNNKSCKDTFSFYKATHHCKVSSKNLIAFSVLQPDGVPTIYKTSVNVCDAISPWQSHTVFTTKRILTILEWSPNSEHLLAGYQDGHIDIWTTPNHILNSWQKSYEACVANENIIATQFFHTGNVVYFHSQKKESPFYAEKFEYIECQPTLQHFGCAAVDGCLSVTASGLIAVFTLPVTTMALMDGGAAAAGKQPTQLNVTTQSLGACRRHIKHCSVMNCYNGTQKIAVIYESQERVVACFSLTMHYEKDALTMSCESLPMVFLVTSPLYRINHIKWASFNKEQVLYVAYDFLDGSVLEQWSFVKRNQNVHKLLQRNKCDFIQMDAWERTGKTGFATSVAQLCVSKLQSDNVKIYAVLKNNTVQYLEYGLKQNGSIDKFANENTTFAAADVSYTNQVMWISDNYGQLYAVQTYSMNIDKNVFFQQVSLLEYCIITGVDSSDILIANIMNLEFIIEKITDNFARQPSYTKHFYYSNFLGLKSNMCRVHSKQHDFDNLIFLHSLSITFKSLLRPSDLNSQDKGPAENLSIILQEPIGDVDKVLFNLDAKDFTVEPLTLQSLQQLIQWVSDLALNILNKLPDDVLKGRLNKKTGYDISRDIGAISSMRELLVMIRIWGLLNPNCLPIYTKSVDNIDILSILFRLLSRLSQNINEPDDILVDECCLLSTQVSIPIQYTNGITTLFNHNNAHFNKLPLLFTSGAEPLYLQDAAQYERVVFLSNTKDCVDNLYLGAETNQLKRCVRCGNANSFRKQTKTLALKAWCNRWQYCHCGGYWISS